VGLLLVVWSVRAQRCFKQLSRLIGLILEAIDESIWLLGDSVVSNDCLGWLIWYWKWLTNRCKLLTSREQRCFKQLSGLIDLILEVIDGLM
jgi:hypothetical protein